MSSGTLFPAPWFTALDANGNPLPGAKAYFYLAGTSTLTTTYSDVSLTPASANANPVLGDSAGRVGPIYLTPGTSVKLVLQDSSGTAVRSQDNIAAIPTSSSSLDVTGTAGEALTAGQAVYLSDGSGSKTAGSWYKGDTANAYSSTVPEVGMAPASIASGASGTVRLSGSVTGLSSLVVGSTYYVGSAGAITATAPTNRRVLGVADTTSSLVLKDPGLPPVTVDTCQGRLTLTTATPITTADVTAATTLYFTPYKGNRLALFDGTAWALRVFSEISIAIPATTSQLYDVFAFDNSGTVALELLAWTNDTTRATALTTQDGIYVKTGATTRRYLGSCRTTTVSGQTEDSATKRYVWNYAQRVRRPLLVREATSSWPYTTATWRQANASTANQVAVVVGWAEPTLTLSLWVSVGVTGSVNLGASIGEDSTTTPHSSVVGGIGQGGANNNEPSLAAFLSTQPAVGYHFYAWLEQSTAAGTTTWFSNGLITGSRSGLSGFIEG